MTHCLPSWAIQPPCTLLVGGDLSEGQRDIFVRLITQLPFRLSKARFSPMDTRPSDGPLSLTTPPGYDEGIRNAFSALRIFPGLVAAHWWDHRVYPPGSTEQCATQGFFLQSPKGPPYIITNLPAGKADPTVTQQALDLLSALLRTPLLVGDTAHARLADLHSLRTTR